MSEKEDFEKFDSLMRSLWSILLSFGMLFNLALVYVIWTRKSLHRPIFFFMICFAVCDIVGCISAVVFWMVVQLWPFTFHSCKLVYFLKTIPRNMKPMLISIVFVVLLTRPDISRRSSFIIIATLSFVSVICALPEGIDSELKSFGSGVICISSLTHHPYMTLMALMMKIVMPLTLLGGYFVIKFTTNRYREMIKESNMQKMVLWMLSIYLICWTPFSLMYYFSDFMIFKVFDSQLYVYGRAMHYTHSFAILTLVYKPFLLYLMNHEFRTEVNRILRREGDQFMAFENRMCDAEVAPRIHDF